MKISNKGDTIKFKSLPANFFKERDSHKCNTIRRFTEWSEMQAFEKFMNEFDFNSPNKMIQISCDCEGFFERKITDITSFEGFFIISWQDPHVVITDGQEIPEEFPKKLEDRICRFWRTCTISGCLGNKPHIENHECGLGHQPLHFYHKNPCARSEPCIQIPEIEDDPENCDCESCHRAEMMRIVKAAIIRR